MSEQIHDVETEEAILLVLYSEYIIYGKEDYR